MRYALALIVAMLTGLWGAPATAQYPSKPVKIIVHIPPGGAPDIAARIVATRLTKSIGQPFIVENREGSNGIVAGEMVAKAAPDGYTLLLAPDGVVVINRFIYGRLPFDPSKDLVPVKTVLRTSSCCRSTRRCRRGRAEFVEYARGSPPLAYASAGNGSQHHLTMEMLKKRAGIELVHVPYRGGAPATTATVSGEVAAMFAGSSTAPQIRSGNLRALAVTGDKPSSAFPELPTIAQTYPGFSNSIWLALFAPAGTPGPVVDRLRAEVNKALAQADVKEKLNRAGGLDSFVTTPEAFAALIRDDYVKYERIVKEVGVKTD